MGRAEGNDIALTDPSLSRFHCRFYFKPDGLMYLADLASTNETQVNGAPIQDVALKIGDLVAIGETTIQVVNDRLDAGHGPVGRDVDLGLHPKNPFGGKVSPGGGGGSRRWVSWVFGLILLLIGVIAGVMVWRLIPSENDRVVAGSQGLELEYEKVQASTQTVFFYSLTLKDGMLSVRVENLQDGRQIQREQKVDERVVSSLAASIDSAGFYALNEGYEGRSVDAWESMDLTVTRNRRVHRVRVINRIEPEAFRETRQKIEEFGQNEIGLGALALPPERLKELAHKAWQAGQNFHQQLEVRNDNLAQAIRSFTEVEWYLETVEPKPDYYVDAMAAREKALRQLNEKYEEHSFQAERAIRLKDWPTANQHLRICLEILPNRSDERYRKVDRKLMDVQSQMERR